MNLLKDKTQDEQIEVLTKAVETPEALLSLLQATRAHLDMDCSTENGLICLRAALAALLMHLRTKDPVYKIIGSNLAYIFKVIPTESEDFTSTSVAPTPED